MADKPTSPAMQTTMFAHQLPPNSSTTFASFSTNNNNNSIVIINNKLKMAAPTASSTSSEAKKPFDISNLMSPPEPSPYDSFAQSSMPKSMGHSTSEMRIVPGPNPPLSPPISPFVKDDDGAMSIVSSPRTPIKDPILYPAQHIGPSPPQQPLFARDPSVDTQQIVDNHVVARPAVLFQEATPPQREDYELMLYFKSQVMKKYVENPRGWLQRERAQLLEDRKVAARHNRIKLQPILPAKPQPIRSQVQRIVKAPRVPKPSQALMPRSIRANPTTPTQRQTAIRRVSVTPDPVSRRGAAPNREDKDFMSIPDYCPPLSSLPSKPNSLKVDWKGAPIDLSNDPHRERLHPDEISLAANLRLDCATYLTSKRRMFVQRLHCLKIDKEFRKTDAQQACKIDVNKASKLWTAFDKVGWLDKRWVAHRL